MENYFERQFLQPSAAQIKKPDQEQPNVQSNENIQPLTYEKITSEQKKQINKFIEENLLNEEKIKEPMSRHCSVSVVIPVYGEREYILRPIESLANQKDVSKDEYELILVLNNPPTEPRRTEDETEADFKRKIDHYKSAIGENQDTLELIKYINGKKTNFIPRDYEIGILEKIKASGLKVYSIDKASPDKTLAVEIANVGGARNRGVTEAVARFFELKKNGVISQSDADTRFDEKYIFNLIKVFKQRPELVGLTGKLDYELEFGDRMISLTSLFGDLEKAYTTLIDDLGRQKTDFKNVKALNFFEQVHFSGANMAGRAFETALVGGVPKIAGGEDPGFGQRLSRIGVIDRISEVVVATADRFSPRTDINAGEGQRKIKFAESLKETNTIKVAGSPEGAMALRNLRRDFVKAIITHNTTPEALGKIFSYEGKPLLSEAEYEILSREISGVEDLWKIVQNKKALAIGKRAMDKITENVNKIPIEEASEKILELLKKDPQFIIQYEEIKKELVEYNNNWIKQRRKKASDLLKVVYLEIGRNNIGDKNTLWRIMKNNTKRIGFNKQDIETLERYPTIFNAMTEIIQQSKTEEQAMSLIEEVFPKEFVFLENNHQHMRLIELKAAHEAFRRTNGTEY